MLYNLLIIGIINLFMTGCSSNNSGSSSGGRIGCAAPPICLIGALERFLGVYDHG